MTDCPMGDLRDLLPPLAAGTLAAAEAARVRAHVTECASCQAEFELLVTVRGRFDAATPVLDLTAIAAAVARGTTGARPAPVREVRRVRTARPWASGRLAAAAASVLLVGALSLTLLQRTFSHATSGVMRPDIDLGVIDSALPGGGVAAAGGSVFGGLSDLDADDLEALLAALDAVEANPVAEPVSLRQPLLGAPEDI